MLVSMEEVRPIKQSVEIRTIEGQYRRQVAVVEARPKLESAGYVAWGMLDVFLLAFFFLTTVLYLAAGTFSDNRLMASLANNIDTTRQVTATRAPQDLVIGNTGVIQHNEATDAYTTITNSNSDWYATFLLKPSTVDSPESEWGFINPGEERTFAMFDLEDFSARDRLVVEDLTWLRVDRHVLGEPSAWLAARSNIAIDNIQYIRDVTVGTSPISRVTFDVSNRTAFSFWQPMFVVRVMRGSSTVAVNQIVVPELVSGEKRQVEVRFFGDLPETATAIIEPAIFYLDPNAYSDTPGGEVSPDIFETL